MLDSKRDSQLFSDCVLAAGAEWAKLSNNFGENLLNLS